MPKTKRLLTEAEAKILDVLWETPNRTMMEITRALAPDTAWSKHTVTTLLKRMVDKGTVLMDAAGSVRRYRPAVEREAFLRLETRELLERLFEGKAALLAQYLAETGELTRADIEGLLKACHDTQEK